MLPLVPLELPRLPRREDSDDTVPVVRFELLGCIDEGEAERAVRVDGRQKAGKVQDIYVRGCGGGGRVEAVVEEGFDV